MQFSWCQWCTRPRSVHVPLTTMPGTTPLTFRHCAGGFSVRLFLLWACPRSTLVVLVRSHPIHRRRETEQKLLLLKQSISSWLNGRDSGPPAYSPRPLGGRIPAWSSPSPITILLATRPICKCAAVDPANGDMPLQNQRNPLRVLIKCPVPPGGHFRLMTARHCHLPFRGCTCPQTSKHHR